MWDRHHWRPRGTGKLALPPRGFLLPRGTERTPPNQEHRWRRGCTAPPAPLQGGSRTRASPGSLRRTTRTFGLSAASANSSFTSESSAGCWWEKTVHLSEPIFLVGRPELNTQDGNTVHQPERPLTEENLASCSAHLPPNLPTTSRPSIFRTTGVASAACPHAGTVGILE